MLMIAESFKELRFAELLQVYEQSNLEAASEWKHLPPMFALQLAEQDFRQYLQDVFFKTPGAACFLWEENGHYVSALRLEPYRDGLLLAALETAPSYRKMGYAAVLIQAVQRHLTKNGAVRLYSHVNKKNVASMRTHEKCGFRVVSDCAVYISGSMDYRSCTLLYEC